MIDNSVAQFNFEFQGGLIETTVNAPTLRKRTDKQKGAVRGNISSFSRKSRSRLIKKMARLDWYKKSVAFISLTFGQQFPSEQEVKRYIDILGKRILRAFPNASFVWKMEYQKRGAPHLHLIVFGLPEGWNENDLRWYWRWTWAHIIDRKFWDYSDTTYVRIPFVQADWIKSKKRAMFYVSKYVAKVDAPADFCEDASADGDGFNYSPYLTASSWTGRFWGIIGRKNLPFAELISTVIEMSPKVFHSFRRMANKKLKSDWRKKTPDKRPRSAFNLIYGQYTGFSLFVNDVHQWFDLLLDCIMSD